MQPYEYEQARLRALAEYGLVDGAPEPTYEEIVRLAAGSCGAPIGLITLIAADHQWIQASVGLGGVRQTPREIAFCDHTIRYTEPLEVRDALDDKRFSCNPLVTGEAGVRFYYGHPLIDPAGHALGALCVLDRRPRTLDARQRAMLAQLAAVTMTLFEGRRRSLEGARLAASVDQDDDEIYILREPDLRVQFMNARARAATRLKGLQVPRRPGFTLGEVVRWTDLDAALLAMERLCADDGQRAELETTDEFGASVRRPVSLRLSRYRWGNDRSILVRVRDLSERHALEAALDEGRERWRFAVEACGVGVLDWDFEAGTAHASAEACRLAGLPAQAPGTITRAAWAQRIHPDDAARVLDAVEAHLAGRTPDYDVEYRLVRADRRGMRVRERGRVLRRAPDGSALHMVAVQHAAGRAVAAQPPHPLARLVPASAAHAARLPGSPATEAADAARDNAEALRSQLDLLTASLAHDVRAPLRALQDFLRDTARRHGALSAAQDNPGSEQGQSARAAQESTKGDHARPGGASAGRASGDADDFAQRLAVARAAGARIEQMVMGLIDYARGGQARARLEPVDARAVFEDAWHALPAAGRARLVLGSLPMLHTDAALLRSVADNLLSNAIKYSRDTAGAVVEVDAEPCGADGGWRIRVRDYGIGFPAEQAHRLFEPFQRLHPQFGAEGTGLGLASVRMIVERLGGACGAFNNPDRGATFWFDLPDADQPAAPQPVPRARGVATLRQSTRAVRTGAAARAQSKAALDRAA